MPSTERLGRRIDSLLGCESVQGIGFGEAGVKFDGEHNVTVLREKTSMRNRFIINKGFNYLLVLVWCTAHPSSQRSRSTEPV
jgi:hypothetical protein